MDLDQLHTFLEIVRLKSFSKAAQSCFRTQPAVSAQVRQLEQECRKRKIPFSLIYWAAELPPLQKRGYADESIWYISIMRQGYDYVMLDGHPDDYAIESWVGAPSDCLPETSEWTFTRSVRDFATRFVPARK